MKRFQLLSCAAVLAVSACGDGSTTQSVRVPSRSPAVVHIDAGLTDRLDTNNQYQLQLKDGRTFAFNQAAGIRNSGTYLSFHGRGYQSSYPLVSVSKLTKVVSGARHAMSFNPDCVDASGYCCSTLTKECYPNPDGPWGWPDDSITIDFTLFGGFEICDFSPSTEELDCSTTSYFAKPHRGDGYKGNVIKSFTFSVSRQDAEVACNPASFTDKTIGTIEYTEFRPGQLPAFTVRSTGAQDANTEVHMHFHPALSSASQVAGVFLFVYPAIGLAANCNKAPADIIP